VGVVTQHQIGDDHHVLHISIGHTESSGVRLASVIDESQSHANHQVTTI